MALIKLERVIIDFPILGYQKSFRSELKRAVGGFIVRGDNKDDRVTIRALEIDFLEIEHGDRVAIIGHNGAGKSTFLKVCSEIYKPVHGDVTIEGKISPLFNIAPGLDVEDSGYENIITCSLLLGMSMSEIQKKRADIIEFCELGEYLSLPVRTYSAGMQMRLAFSIATAIDPEILILDEGLGTGDAKFTEKASKRVSELVEKSHILLFASHSIPLIRSMCNKALYLEKGKVVKFGDIEDVISLYEKRQ